MRLSDDRGIARSPATLRVAARLVVRHGVDRGLVAFRVADTHLHVVAASDRQTAGQLAHATEAALRQVLALPVAFEPARIRPIESPRHLLAAFRYVLRQETHHGTAFDREHDGSILPDLLGMRLIGAEPVVARVRTLLPRLCAGELLAWVGVEQLDAVATDFALVTDAAAAALALPSLAGQSHGAQAARLAAVHLFGHELSAAEIGSRLALTQRRVQALRSTPPQPELLSAARRQLQWRSALRQHDIDVIEPLASGPP